MLLLFIFCIVSFSQKLRTLWLPILFKNEAIEKPLQKLVTNVGLDIELKIGSELTALPWKTAKVKWGRLHSGMLISIPAGLLLTARTISLANFFLHEDKYGTWEVDCFLASTSTSTPVFLSHYLPSPFWYLVSPVLELQGDWLPFQLQSCVFIY